MDGNSYSGLNLLYLPPVKLEQLILGYIYDAMYAGRLIRVKDLARTLVDRLTIQPPWTLPSNLRRLAKQLAPVFESGEQILRNHTCLPAHLPFATPANQSRVLAHALDGVRHRGLAGVIGLGGNFVEVKPRLALCPTCVREDELKTGAAWWRRAHSLAGVTFCAKHGLPLLVGCGSCRFSQIGTREPLLPSIRCWCQNDRVALTANATPADSRVFTRVARYAEQLLKGQLDGFDAADLGTYYQHRAYLEGFKDGTRIHSPLLARTIEGSYSVAVLSTLNATINDRSKWVEAVFGSGVASPVLGRNLLFFDTFGQRVPTAEDILHAREHQRRIQTQRQVGRQRTPTGTLDEVMADRKAIEAFLHSNPGASRTTALRALGRTVQRARERDSDWYDAALPAKPRGSQAAAEDARANYFKTFDARGVTHVLRRREELLNSPGGYPKAITKTALLKGLPRGNELSEEFLQHLPKTATAIVKSVETREQFQRRLALVILRGDGVGTLAERLTEAYLRTGLSPAVLEELNFSLVKELPWASRRRSNDS